MSRVVTSVEERYRTDPQFHNLVQQLLAGIMAAQFTPTEIREAALLAQIIYERMQPRRIMVQEVEDRETADSRPDLQRAVLRGPDAVYPFGWRD